MQYEGISFVLNDFQKLLGNINWLRPMLGIPNYQLSNLFSLLKGDSNLSSKRQLTPLAEKELQAVEERIKHAFLTRITPGQSISLLLLHTF